LYEREKFAFGAYGAKKKVAHKKGKQEDGKDFDV
jgi:hypothetical protein